MSLYTYLKTSSTLCCLTLFTLLPNSVFARDQIRISTGEWGPFISQELEHQGFMLRIIKEAFALENVDVSWGFFPWKRAMLYAKNGKWDATAVWVYSADRASHFLFSDPIIKNSDVFFHLVSTPLQWNKLSDLKGLNIGGTSGYFYGEAFHQAAESAVFNYSAIHSETLNMKKLLRGKITAFPANLHAGFHLAKKILTADQLSKLTFHPKPLKEDFLHLLFTLKSADSQRYLDKFNRGLKQLKENGTLDRIIQESILSSETDLNGSK